MKCRQEQLSNSMANQAANSQWHTVIHVDEHVCRQFVPLLAVPIPSHTTQQRS